MSQTDALVARLAERLMAGGERLVSAESCTGGLIAAACTSIAGSSAWFERGFVTYSNEAKAEALGVDPASIATYGAVSAEVAEAMASGALRRSRATVAVSVTGIAGPGGGTPAKPVGTVWIATAMRDEPARATLFNATGDRASIRAQSVERALALVLSAFDPDKT